MKLVAELDQAGPSQTPDKPAGPSAGALAARSAAWAVLLVPAALALWSAHAIRETYAPIPYWDEWVEMNRWRTAPDHWLAYLWSQHNEHRILFPRLVFLADWKWFQARDGLNLLAVGLIQLAGAAFFVTAARVRGARPLTLLGLAVGAGLLCLLLQWQNLFWGFQVQFVGVYAASAWAIYAFATATREPGATRRGSFCAAMALLVVATFSMSNGVLAGAVMVAVGLATRRSLRATALAGIVTAALLVLYLHDFQPVPHHSPAGLVLQHPGRFVTFAAAYLGSIWFPKSVAGAACAGLLGGLATAGMLLVLVREGGRDASRSALFGVALLVLASASITAFGRLMFGVEGGLSSRYMTPAAYFWAAQALFWPLTLERAGPALARRAAAVVLVAGVAALIPLQAIGDHQIRKAREETLLGASALLGRVDDPEAVHALYLDTDFVQDVAAFLRARRLALFSDPPVATVGERFVRAAAAAELCRGSIDILTPVPHAAAPATWRILGWGWDVEARSAFSRVVLVDDRGEVLGIGLSGMTRDDVPRGVRQVTTRAAGWMAAADRGAGTEIAAYGILRNGRACPLGRRAWP